MNRKTGEVDLGAIAFLMEETGEYDFTGFAVRLAGNFSGIPSVILEFQFVYPQASAHHSGAGR